MTRIGGVVMISAVLSLSACGAADADCDGLQCGPVPPAVTLTVVDARGGPLTGVAVSYVGPDSVDGREGTCASSVDGLTWTCTLLGGGGNYRIDVTAPGHAPAHVDGAVQPIEGCCPSVVPVQHQVALQPSA